MGIVDPRWGPEPATGAPTEEEERAVAFVQAAHAYSEMHWALIRADGKKPRGRNWQNTAPAEPGYAAGLWAEWGKRSNMGVVLGTSDLAVFEYDDDDAAERFLELLGGELPETPICRTGSGKLHVYFSAPAGLPKIGREGLELRAGGHHCLVPPSVHPDTGQPYEWLPGHAPGEVIDLLPLPSGIIVYFEADAPARRNGRAPAVGDVIPIGEIDTTLTSLAGTMRRRGMAEDAIYAALVETLKRCEEGHTHTAADCQRIAGSVSRYPPAASPTDEPDRALDDIGNAARFADVHHPALRFAPAWGRWLRWDGRRWADDDVLEHVRRARATARALAEEAAAEEDERLRKDLLGHARRSAAEPRLRAMLTVAAADERIVVRPAELDENPWVLNAENGTVDLRGGELRPHRPADRLTMLAGTAYEPAARAPLWDAHLRLCLITPEMIAFLQRLAGLAAIGLTREHILPIFYGPGGNGKSKTRNALAGVLGDYAAQSTVDLLLQTGRSAGRATPELADLRGRRLVTVSESPEDGRLVSERVKAITGGEPITARRLHGNPFTFTPSHTVLLLTNHKPRVPDDSPAIWRRVLLIPFNVTIPEADRDPAIDEKLAREYPGILRWIVEGALAYQREGLNPPHEVRVATASYREQEDAFAAFLDERTSREPNARAGASALLAAHNEWATRSGAPHLSRNALAEKLLTHGYERERDKRGVHWHGLRLVEEGTLNV
jgi:putative DNA primase/helicase